jgi:cytochrome c oxidase subunit 2
MKFFSTAPGLIFGALANASTLAPRVTRLFDALLATSALVVVALAAINLFFLIRYRRGSTAPRTPLRMSAVKLEITWISATTAIFLGFFFWGAWIYLDEERVPAAADEIHVTGRQWMWDVRHPDGRREFNELHVPVGTPIRLVLSSEDVIHSFFVPAFRVKQDAVPGKIVSTWFEATEPGSYHLFCAQFCGTEHSGMVGQVVAMKPEDYARWLSTGNQPEGLSGRGRALFTRYGCSGCHAPASVVHAPLLEGLYGKLQPVENGQFVRVDETYLRDSILLPGQHVVAGYANVMPSFQGVIPEGDLIELIAYLKSLGDGNPAPPPNGNSLPAAP